MLDEVDKMASDFRGDPASALLEVLDPEQNTTFQDHYLDVDYDLSQVLFVATANVLHTIPAAAAGPHGDPAAARLHRGREAGDREAIPGQEAARGHRAEREEHRPSRTMRCWRSFAITRARPACATWSARSATSAARWRARWSRTGRSTRKRSPRRISSEFLGVAKFRDSEVHEKSEVGLVTGLAWTEVGGSILHHRGAGAGRQRQADDYRATGRRDAGVGAGRAELHPQPRAAPGAAADFYRNIDIHVHVPEGAIPKDGPSAGITMATALASALAKIPVRRDIAMTGEITLRGKVLPIGGLKEKLLAAHRAGNL